MVERFEDATVGDIVALDYRAAGVLEQFGIDFCCGGRRSLADACAAAGADRDAVTRALDAIPARSEREDDPRDWPLDRLVNHIVSAHHRYVRSALPVAGRHLAKLVTVHGERHPELRRVAALLDELGRDLQQHMTKEEQVLFPYVCELGAGVAVAGQCPFGTVDNPIRMMEREHVAAGDIMRTIRELTNGYTPPPDGCATYQVALQELGAFERDLHRHVHLENNVLFPRAKEYERALWQS